MNSRRFAQMATALCGTVGLAGWVVASLAGLGSPDIENAVVSIEDRRSPSLTGKVVDARQATALGNFAVASADAATVAELATGTAALPNRSQVLPPEAPPGQVATANTPDRSARRRQGSGEHHRNSRRVPGSGNLRRPILWALYQRTPKQDSIKAHELKEVTVKKSAKP